MHPGAAKDLVLLFGLRADHERSASTSTVRLGCSTGANPYACIAAGVAALWGPAHGGANEAVLKMLAEIGNAKHVQSAVDKAKDKESGFRLMGFGHRVYKNFDPRAKIIREMCHQVLDELGVDDPMLEVAMRLEEAALKDDYFVQRKLYPNVDFYSGIIYKALGIPTEMFTVMFAIARTAGWVAHWLEQQEDPEFKIGCPGAKFIREVGHEVVDERGGDDPMFEVAMRLEEAALKDDYFGQRKLYPNVDFYSGIIYKALGIPTEMFTVMFAIARTAGWVAHWLEQQEDPEFKIGRPRQIYTGHDARDYVAVDKR